MSAAYDARAVDMVHLMLRKRWVVVPVTIGGDKGAPFRRRYRTRRAAERVADQATGHTAWGKPRFEAVRLR